MGFDEFVKLFESEIKGEFAFALIELDNQDNLINVTLGRDMLGIRPLYVSNAHNNK